MIFAAFCIRSSQSKRDWRIAPASISFRRFYAFCITVDDAENIQQFTFHRVAVELDRNTAVTLQSNDRHCAYTCERQSGTVFFMLSIILVPFLGIIVLNQTIKMSGTPPPPAPTSPLPSLRYVMEKKIL